MLKEIFKVPSKDELFFPSEMVTKGSAVFYFYMGNGSSTGPNPGSNMNLGQKALG